MRFAAAVEYDGSQFHGWQQQDHQPATVQAVVEMALSRVADRPVAVVCAGRTDSGVHATLQIIHFDSEARRDERAWLLGGNAHLPSSVVILWVVAVSESFHARFAATRRGYHYLILERPVRPALLSRRVTWSRQPLDLAAMQQAAQHLLGEHDFTSYRAVGCQARNPRRTIYRLDLARCGDLLVMQVEANAFLHHMVRNIAGVLMTIGRGERPAAWSGEVLARCDRRAGGVTAAADGLYLTAVHYPEHYALPLLSRPPLLW
jgi:tRNA pseudouridine38-40 synthase